jgi:hypothetical protein
VDGWIYCITRRIDGANENKKAKKHINNLIK